MDKFKRFWNADEAEAQREDDENILTQIYDGTTLSWSTRIKAFVICFAVGCVLSILSTICLAFPNKNSLKLFAVLYSFGNLTALSGTIFLMGPIKQMKNMFKEKRIFTTLIALLFLALTLCAALWWDIAILAIIFCICQFLAFIWYSLSYIPYARDAVRKCICACIE
ncbi:vesicle transport protein SFT2B-like [Amphiura filiformis]|uniref:vesicle transport protein SFT2B-like n=1 Tax=Amphiura filiformis TaxID=82378 RepID=UPI003B210C0C